MMIWSLNQAGVWFVTAKSHADRSLKNFKLVTIHFLKSYKTTKELIKIKHRQTKLKCPQLN